MAGPPDVSELEAMIRSRDDFISLVGHEIRNSIAPLVMLAEQFETCPDGIPAARVAMLLRNLRRFVVMDLLAHGAPGAVSGVFW